MQIVLHMSCAPPESVEGLAFRRHTELSFQGCVQPAYDLSLYRTVGCGRLHRLGVMIMTRTTTIIRYMHRGTLEIHIKLGGYPHTINCDYRFVYCPLAENPMLRQRAEAPEFEEIMELLFPPYWMDNLESYVAQNISGMRVVWHGRRFRLRVLFWTVFFLVHTYEETVQRVYAPDGQGALAAKEHFWAAAEFLNPSVP